MKFTKYILIATIFSFILSPVTAQEVGFKELAVAENLSVEARLAKKVSLTQNALGKAIEKTNEMRTKLGELVFEEGSLEDVMKNEFWAQANQHLEFYEAHLNTLSSLQSLEQVDALIEEIIQYRENTYAPEAKKILEYLLIFSYTPSVIETATDRLEKIAADMNKLHNLELVEEGHFAEASQEAQDLLSQAQELSNQSRELLIKRFYETQIELTVLEQVEIATSTDTLEGELQPHEPKGLTEASLNKVKDLYALFLQTSQQIEQALGIQKNQE